MAKSYDDRSIWEDDPEYPVEDWQCEVAEDSTRLGYWAWVDSAREQANDDN